MSLTWIKIGTLTQLSIIFISNFYVTIDYKIPIFNTLNYEKTSNYKRPLKILK